MPKPASLLQNEFSEKLDNLVNEYLQQIPAFVIKPIVGNALQQIAKIEEQQLKADIEAWEKEQKEGEKNDCP